jgi:hypothetical protein
VSFYGLVSEKKEGKVIKGLSRKEFLCFLAFLSVVFLFTGNSEAEEDLCLDVGVVVRNITTIDLWYKKNGGDCVKWKQNKIFLIRTDEKLTLFSDLICETKYCDDDLNYDSYRSFDSDNDCRVKILTGCSISDM